nr:sugar transferase [uncultured Carboxylicivirga sp.]
MAAGETSIRKVSDHKPISALHRSSTIYRLIKSQGEDVFRFMSENASLTQKNIAVFDFNHHRSTLTQSGFNVIIDLNPLIFKEGQKYLYQLNHLLGDGGLLLCNIKMSESKYYKLFKYRKSKAEVMGRLVNAGFTIIDFRNIKDTLHICVMKIALPKIEPANNNRFIIPMERIGKGGNRVKVYKIRTMYPYSEYLQEYVVGMNGYNTKGKPKDDFRLTRLGKFLRKYWIDELPQLFNLLKGDLALVGVRPLSEARFKELPEDIRQKRVQFKPGCIPPYVSLLMADNKGNIEAERIYMEEKEKYPYTTNIKYFFLAVYNILTGKIRSA